MWRASPANARPGDFSARETLVKSLVRLGEYEDALEGIEIMRSKGHLRDSLYLRGFLERHRGRHNDAVKYYSRAVQEGRGGLAIHRDLAECYLHLGDFRAAAEHVEIAQSRQADNPYVVSLRIKIGVLAGK